MCTPEQIRDWLRKMQYPDPNPSEEALKTFCRGAMGPIFQQIIDRVKPKQEIDHCKKAILISKLGKGQMMKLSSSKVSQNIDGLEKLRLYNEKRKLEKQLKEINAQNIENEISLEHLKAKIKTKYAKIQTIKEKLKESEKDIVLYKAKSDNLQKQIESCQKLHAQSKILERTSNKELDTVRIKVSEVVLKLYNIISSFIPQLSPGIPDLPTISENSCVGSLNTSVILSSNKRPLSSIKSSRRANSTRTNLAEITNNHSLLSSTLRKRNLSKISFMSSSNSTLSSPSNSFGVDKNVEAVKELEQLCWNDQIVVKFVDELWESDCESVFKILFDLKKKHANKISEMISYDDTGKKDYDLKNICDIEKLYAFHIETEMKRMICEQEQNKIQKMLDKINFEDVGDITVLKATEFSLQNSVEHVRNSIMKLEQDVPDNSEKLNQIFDEIHNIQTEVTSTKSKIESDLCILRECSSWMSKHRNNILESIRKPQLYSEYELLKSDIAEQEAKNFVSCPFQSQKIHYFESWTQIYRNAELLEIIQRPYLSPENIVKLFFEQKTWLHQLQLHQKEADQENLNKSLALVNVTYDEKQMNNSYKKSMEQLHVSAFTCSNILKQLSQLDIELKYFLESSLNECVAPNIKFENKTLKEYCEIYDSYYKQL